VAATGPQPVLRERLLALALDQVFPAIGDLSLVKAMLIKFRSTADQCRTLKII
jgi:hypothetical protein